MNRPIVIPMEDELIHTQERPYCNDPACPCHKPEKELTTNVPPKSARREGKRKRGSARRRKNGSQRS
jgi:hypothetical protein